MVQTVRSMGLSGIQGYEVSVECSLSGGLPAFDVVGLPDAAVKEARERVRSATKNCGLKFPVSRITVNLAPADRKKIGTLYDLPVMLAMLAAAGDIRPLPETAAFLGELSLSGELRPIRGALPMALAAVKCGIRELYVPAENGAEASFAQGVTVYPVPHVQALLKHLKGEEKLQPAQQPDLEDYREPVPDFADVKGQENVKRALEIAAAGGHNILMVGPPGAGKSMLAKRIPGILPDMGMEEILETTEIYSVLGLTGKDRPLITQRPFRSPHHTVSSTAMAGGGAMPKPGEISLAHNGVLFLDELPEFRSDTLEVLRQPLEDGRVVISRAAGHAAFPSRFMLVCAMNPCKCGWYGHPSGKCTCSENAVRKYQSRISGPLLDRIDMLVEVPALEYAELRSKEPAERSADVKRRVNAARDRQRQRQGGGNGAMDQAQMAQFCQLSEVCEALMAAAYDRLGLTARSYDRILRVARTIADLEGAADIAPEHLAEAIQYRTFSFAEAQS